MEQTRDAVQARIATLSATKQALLNSRLRQRAQDGGIRPVPRTGPLLPSLQQEGLWLLDQLNPGQIVYNVPFAWRLRGPLDVPALHRALHRLTGRHEALRTRFASAADGTPRLVIDPPEPRRPLPVEDISGAPDPYAKALELADAEAQHSFDLAAGPLLRTGLLRLGDDDHVLLLNLHHSVTDGWSVSILLDELSDCYDAYRKGSEPELTALPLQAADIAAWQRARLRGDGLAAQLRYWRETLRGLPTLDLPTDRPRPTARSWAGESHRAPLSPELGGRLRGYALARHCSLLATLLAGFTVVLSRYTGQHDIPVGSIVGGRHRPEVERLVGYFANTVVLRADLTGDPSFAELTARCNDTVLGALEHQDVPFSTIVSDLKPERDPGRNPLFQTSFSLQPAGAVDQGYRLGPLVAEALPFTTTKSRFDLTTTVIQHPDDELEILLEYATELFDADRIQRLVGHLDRVLRAALDDPDRPISALPLLDDDESALLASFNDTGVDYGPAACLHETIARQAAATPDAVAVRCADEELTYAELDRRADRLAGRLAALGAGPDVPVGICAHRSVDLMVGLLGILKAGSAYVPLDPDHPRERLRFLLDDTAVPVVLTQPDLAPLFAGLGTPTLDLADEGTDAPPPTAATPDSLAYVLYTSGSTGQPKGVMVEHRAIHNRLTWMQRQYPIGPGDTVLQKTPYTFDVSVWEFFWPLMVGARLVLARPEGHRDSAYLAKVIRAERVTTLHFVPAMLRHFLAHLDARPDDAGERDRFPDLARVFCSGEALTADLRDDFFRHVDAELHNLYGPTEAAVDVTYWQCRPEHREVVVPIGRPIANIRCHVLDPDGNRTPVGVPGELHLAGVGLARGYLNRDDLTARAFVTHAGERLYRTGDVARWRADGTLEYLGRNDHQVKINGQRIELGEIEHALAGHPDVGHAVAGTWRPDGASAAHLVAWITTDRPEVAAELPGYLAERLPAHLVPATVTVVDAMPTTTSGKVDRKQLPPPVAAAAPTDDRPLTPVERELAAIWSALTGAADPRPHDNFFAIGGNSLHAVQLTRRIGDRLRVDLPLRQLYATPTLASMAAAVAEQLAGTEDDGAAPPSASVSLVPLRAETTPPLFLVHPVGGTVAAYVPLVAALPPSVRVWGFEAADHGTAEVSVPDLAARYVGELRSVQPHGPYRLGGWSFGGIVAYEMARHLRDQGEQVETLLMIDTSAPAPDEATPDEAQLMVDFAADVAALQDAPTPPLQVADLAGLPLAEQVACTARCLVEQGLVPADATDEVARRITVFRAHVRAFYRWRPAPLDTVVTLVTAEKSGDHHADRWAESGLARLRRRTVPGGHYDILRPPHLDDLAATVAAALPD
jgi:amino acid adenylation domain-containing protein